MSTVRSGPLPQTVQCCTNMFLHRMDKTTTGSSEGNICISSEQPYFLVAALITRPSKNPIIVNVTFNYWKRFLSFLTLQPVPADLYALTHTFLAFFMQIKTCSRHTNAHRGHNPIVFLCVRTHTPNKSMICLKGMAWPITKTVERGLLALFDWYLWKESGGVPFQPLNEMPWHVRGRGRVRYV